MGSSPSIADLQAKDKEFQDYLNSIEQNLNTKAAAAAKQMETDISNFYTSNKYDDAKALVSGRNIDFLHQSEFSLENLKKVIDAVSAAVFSGGSVPQGADVNREAVQNAGETLGEAVGAISNLELYIAGKVFDVLSSVVMSFGTGTTVSYTSNTKSAALGYGIQMFTSVAASSYESTSFFRNEYINEYLFMYDVRFSVRQSEAEAQMGLVQLYSNELAAYEKLLNELIKKLLAGKVSPEAYKSARATYSQFIADAKAELIGLKALSM